MFNLFKKRFLRSVAAAILSLACGAPSHAGQIGTTSLIDSYKATYAATSDFTTLASSATDFFTIYGSGSKTIKVLRIYLSSSSTGTAAVFDTVSLIKRSTAPTGGTATTITSCPLDSNNSSATATVKIWTANPTTVGTAVATINVAKYNGAITGVTSSTSVPNYPRHCVFDADKYGQAITLRGTGEGLALNLAGVTQAGTSPKMNVEVIYTEE